MKNSSYIHGQYPAPKSNQVGLFYFLWLGEHGRTGPYDVSKILAADPDAGRKPDSPVWGGHGSITTGANRFMVIISPMTNGLFVVT